MDKLIGHQSVYNYLNRAITAGVSHAFCLIGPEHVGKTTLVNRIIQKLFCQSPLNNQPDGLCLSCRQIEIGQYGEVLWLKRQVDKKNIGIEEIRKLKEFASLSSYRSGRRVVVIEGASDLSQEAANALIKILEEPPMGLVFFILTDSELSLIPTVLSRCQVIKLGLISNNLIAAGLISRGVSEQVSQQLSTRAAGRPGLAILYQNQSELWQSETQSAETFLEILNSHNIWQTAQTLFDQEFKKDKDVEKTLILLSIWQEVVRDALFVKLGLNNYLRYQNLKNKIELLVKHKSLTWLAAAAYSVFAARRQLSQNAQVRLVMDNLITRLI